MFSNRNWRRDGPAKWHYDRIYEEWLSLPENEREPQRQCRCAECRGYSLGALTVAPALLRDYCVTQKLMERELCPKI